MKKAAELVATYDRVHDAIADGKSWADIDCGLEGGTSKWSYEAWNGYMEQRLRLGLKSILLASGLMKKAF